MKIDYTERQKQDIGRMMGVYRDVIVKTERYEQNPHPQNALFLTEAIDKFFKKIPREIRSKIEGACDDKSWMDLKKSLKKK